MKITYKFGSFSFVVSPQFMIISKLCLSLLKQIPFYLLVKTEKKKQDKREKFSFCLCWLFCRNFFANKTVLTLFTTALDFHWKFIKLYNLFTKIIKTLENPVALSSLPQINFLATSHDTSRQIRIFGSHFLLVFGFKLLHLFKLFFIVLGCFYFFEE